MGKWRYSLCVDVIAMAKRVKCFNELQVTNFSRFMQRGTGEANGWNFTYNS